jgi:phosphoglycerate dehydrogenase-like enzyme
VPDRTTNAVASVTLGVSSSSPLTRLSSIRARRQRRTGTPNSDPAIGNYGRAVGLVGASRISRRVLALLAPFDLEVLISDPYLDEAAARSLGARLVGLDELFARGDVVSLHAPAVPATRGLVNAGRLAALAMTA